MNKNAIKAMILSALAVGTLNSNIIFAEENVSSNNLTKNVVSRSLSLTGQVVKVSSNLNIRKTASTSAVVVGKMSLNTKFDIISKSGSWYKIKYGSITGYVSADYVKVISQASNNTENSGSSTDNSSNSNTETTISTTGKGQVVKVSSNLNIRKTASTSAVVVGKMSLNTKFDIISKSGSWYKIKYGSITGYVSADYVKVISQASNNTENSGSSTDNSSNSNTETTISTTGKGQVVKVSSNLNIRKTASTSAVVVGKMSLNAKFDIMSKSGSWYKIKYGSITGYVSADYVKVIEDSNGDSSSSNEETNPNEKEESLNDVYGIVTGLNQGSSLRVRKSPSTSSDVLGYVSPSQKIQLIAKSGDWYKIAFGSGAGYISRSYVEIVNYDPNKPQDDATKAKFQKVLSKITTQVGSPYVYGGAGELITRDLITKMQDKYPSQDYFVADEFYDKEWRAFDCSGLLYWAFSDIGVTLGRNTAAQINNGIEVDLDSLQPGDLIFYKTLNHVGMYVGDGKWVEAPKTGLFVRITDVPWNLVSRARRIL